MTLDVCLRRGADAGLVKKARAQEATDIYLKYRKQYREQGHPDHVADNYAAIDAKAAMRKTVGEDRHRYVAQLGAMRKLSLFASQATADEGAASLFRLQESSVAFARQGGSIASDQAALTQQFNGMMREFLNELSPAKTLTFGTRNKALMREVIREATGESTGNPMARSLAEAMGKTIERARQMFNEAGGHIPKMEGYDIPHKWDRAQILKAGEARFVEDMTNRIDWNRINDKLTGRPLATDTMPASDAVKQRFLKDIYKSIAEDGAGTTPIYGKQSGKSVARGHGEQRILHFKSADDWLAMNDAYGSADPFGSVVGHLDVMARDIAMMRSFGPNPQAGLDYLHGSLRNKFRDNPQVLDKLDSQIVAARATLAHHSGAAGAPVNRAWARFFSGVRSTMVSAHLGSAVLVSGSDSMSMGLMAHTIGMNPGNLVSRHMKLIASGATRETAARMGYVAGTLADGSVAAARFTGDLAVAGLPHRAASTVMKWSGLSFWTDQARTAVQMEFAGVLADARTMGDLHPLIASRLKNRGISEADWSQFADEALHFKTQGGERFAAPLYWREAAIKAGMKPSEADRISLAVQGVANDFQEVAVPTNSNEMRARIMGDARPGSFSGEAWRSALSYKSFTMTFTANQYRMTMLRQTIEGRAAYLATMIAGMTFMGSVGIQLKELAKGNEPRPMDDWKFWGAAMLQGGGMGVAGDLVSSGTTRYGGGLPGYLAGPVVGLTADTIKLTAGNAVDAAAGRDMNLGRDLVQYGQRYTPGSTLWPTRTVMDRWVWDQMQILLDPEAHQDMRRRVQRQERDRGNGEIWASGDANPFD